MQPVASPLTSQFHIIQPQVVKKNNRSSGVRSVCSRCSLRCCSSVPPTPCTMHFGTPVVPEEYITYSGASNGTRVNSSAAPARPNSPKATAPRNAPRSGAVAT